VRGRRGGSAVRGRRGGSGVRGRRGGSAVRGRRGGSAVRGRRGGSGVRRRRDAAHSAVAVGPRAGLQPLKWEPGAERPACAGLPAGASSAGALAEGHRFPHGAARQAAERRMEFHRDGLRPPDGCASNRRSFRKSRAGGTLSSRLPLQRLQARSRADRNRGVGGVPTASHRTPTSTASHRTPTPTASHRTPTSTASHPTPTSTASHRTPTSTASHRTPTSTASHRTPTSTASHRTPTSTASHPTPTSTKQAAR
jgi:hypothetical protein